MNIHQRLSLFYQRLEQAAPARNAEEALALICRELEWVEAAYCPVPAKAHPPITFDGRMYPPQADYIRRRSNGGLRIKTRREIIFISPNGGIRIHHVKRRTLEFKKAGLAGQDS